MISSQDFPACIFKEPRAFDNTKEMDNIIGFDSEAYTTGVPFMFCTSLGDTFTLEDFPHKLFEPPYIDCNFVLYNMKYDSGAILYYLPKKVLKEIWEFTEAEHEGYKYKYLSKKILRITKGKQRVSFWDIAQFYKMSLDNASKIYLNQSKNDMPTKQFTPENVKKLYLKIQEYCIQDARLTQALGVHLIKKLLEFGVSASTIYSCASISFKYFASQGPVITAFKLWKDDKKAVALACDAYEGGKFEMTSRGFFPEVYEYDLTSAYPYEIASLVDITDAEIIHSREYHKDAVYGFIRCFIDNTKGMHLPCGIKDHSTRVYPKGRYFLTITKGEYEYLRQIDVPVTILQAAWFFVKERRFPYRNTILGLYTIKDFYKGKDTMLYSTTKIIMNSFYGKTCQCTKLPTGEIQLGAGFNPVYASEITANTRLKVCKIQNEYKEKCLAVHTDSVMLTEKLPESYVPGGLGNFEFVVKGKAFLIACGMYQIDKDNAFKGFRPEKGIYWEHILERYANKKTIPYHYLHVESWIEAMAKNHEMSDINVFTKDKKNIDLNCDVKRVWPSKVKARDLATSHQNSDFKIHDEKYEPDFWN